MSSGGRQSADMMMMMRYAYDVYRLISVTVTASAPLLLAVLLFFGAAGKIISMTNSRIPPTVAKRERKTVSYFY